MSAMSASSLRSARMSGACSSARSRWNAATSSDLESTRITPRLPESSSGLTTHGNARSSASAAGSAEMWAGTNDGTGRPASRSRSRLCSLLRATIGRERRMAREPEAFENPRGNDRRPIADRKHAVDRALDRRVQDRRRRSELVVEADRQRLVAPRVVEHVAAIGRVDEIDAEPLRRLAERARLVSGRRRKQQDSGHFRLRSLSFRLSATASAIS